MNKDDVLRFLMSALSSIQVADELIPELIALLAGTGSENSIFNLLLMRLSFLQNLGAKAVQHKEFEAIGNGLYSMHLTGKGFNIRILYSFLPDRSPILLCAFYERGGKRKTDYTPYKGSALSRLERFKGEF